MKSLKAQHHTLADARAQIDVIEHGLPEDTTLPPREKLQKSGLYPLKPTEISILQVNVGKMCNQTCKHCHVDAGADRKEIMTRETMLQCLAVLEKNEALRTVDLTGGAPEMNPEFRWFASEIARLGRHIIARCNLTIILASRKYHDLPQFYRQHGIEVVSSFPFMHKTARAASGAMACSTPVSRRSRCS